MKRSLGCYRAEVLDSAPLRYAPLNELGVVFLFAHLAKKWRLRIDVIRPSFPDCIAYQKIQGKERRVRIEFEHRSRNFVVHGHDPGKCDWIVCWEHDWPGAPKRLRILELRREFGLGFNVWIMPIREPYKDVLAAIESADDCWSLPSQCHKGDLILYYFTRPEKMIQHVFTATDRAARMAAGWKAGKDFMGPIRRVCRLNSPIFYEDLCGHRVLSTAPCVRGSMRGRPNVTEYWPYLYDLIVKRNPGVRKALRRFAPDRI